jgi:hypothetical protein
MNNKTTEFGFDFGSMTITRTAQDEKSSIVSVSTKKCKINIRATTNGSVRFFDDQSNECELVNKGYLVHLERIQSKLKENK